MRQRLYHRLQQLEKENARLRSVRQSRDREADLEKATNKVKLFLRLRAVEKTGVESLMEAWARALEITLRELSGQLMAGVNPIKKWFSENGIYEAIERRKAARTWPAAEGKRECKAQALIE